MKRFTLIEHKNTLISESVYRLSITSIGYSTEQYSRPKYSENTEENNDEIFSKLEWQPHSAWFLCTANIRTWKIEGLQNHIINNV